MVRNKHFLSGSGGRRTSGKHWRANWDDSSDVMKRPSGHRAAIIRDNRRDSEMGEEGGKGGWREGRREGKYVDGRTTVRRRGGESDGESRG